MTAQPWHMVVRQWGLEPLKSPITCDGIGWSLGEACGRCRKCAEDPNRPPPGTDIAEWLRVARVAVKVGRDADRKHSERRASDIGRWVHIPDGPRWWIPYGVPLEIGDVVAASGATDRQRSYLIIDNGAQRDVSLPVDDLQALLDGLQVVAASDNLPMLLVKQTDWEAVASMYEDLLDRVVEVIVPNRDDWPAMQMQRTDIPRQLELLIEAQRVPRKKDTDDGEYIDIASLRELRDDMAAVLLSVDERQAILANGENLGLSGDTAIRLFQARLSEVLG